MKYLDMKNFQLEPFQADFVYSPVPFPAYVGAWGTGKTLCLIARSLAYSELIPNNLGFIIRREFTDLQDSTIRDFENYTGMKVNSKREVAFPNGSVICFRHFEELVQAGAKGHKNLQNVNLGWAAIEQAEELETDRAFWLLFGRLRRALKPTAAFSEWGLPPRSIFLIANVAGDNWIKRFWKSGQIDRPELKGKFQLIEAKTQDNAHNLPAEFMENLEILKTKKPEMYQRYVLNDWTAEVTSSVFRNLDAIMDGIFLPVDPTVDYAIGIDLAKSQDFNVVSVLNTRTKHFDYVARWNKTSWGLTKERIRKIAKAYNDAHCFVDATGVGDPVVEDLMRVGVKIYCENEKVYAGIKLNNTNKMQMIERYVVAIEEKMISWPDPKDLPEKSAEIMRTWISEHRMFKAELTATRKIRYASPEGEHDDCVVSGMLAVHGLFSELYEIYTDEPEVLTRGQEFWEMVNNDMERSRIRRSGEEEEIPIMEEGSRFLS